MFSTCYNCNNLINIKCYSHCDKCINVFICLNCLKDKQLIEKRYIDSECKKCAKKFNKKIFYCKKHNNYIKTPMDEICKECIEILLPFPNPTDFNLPI
jgi:hypothetical protein